MSRVKQYMMRTLNSVSRDDTISHAIRFMHKTEMSVLPVVDEENKFLGTIYGNNILKNIIPERYGFLETHRILYEINESAENLEEIRDRQVSDYMSEKAVAVAENDRMDRIADIMLHNEESIVFVTNKGGNLRGYVSRADLLYYLLDVAKGAEM
ncbi:MAG: HPP family protein [Halanaerobiaceae bacterium]